MGHCITHAGSSRMVCPLTTYPSSHLLCSEMDSRVWVEVRQDPSQWIHHSLSPEKEMLAGLCGWWGTSVMVCRMTTWSSHLGLQHDGAWEREPSHWARPPMMLLSIHMNAPCLWSSFLREMGKDGPGQRLHSFSVSPALVGRHFTPSTTWEAPHFPPILCLCFSSQYTSRLYVSHNNTNSNNIMTEKMTRVWRFFLSLWFMPRTINLSICSQSTLCLSGEPLSVSHTDFWTFWVCFPKYFTF